MLPSPSSQILDSDFYCSLCGTPFATNQDVQKDYPQAWSSKIIVLNDPASDRSKAPGMTPGPELIREREVIGLSRDGYHISGQDNPVFHFGHDRHYYALPAAARQRFHAPLHAACHAIIKTHESLIQSLPYPPSLYCRPPRTLREVFKCLYSKESYFPCSIYWLLRHFKDHYIMDEEGTNNRHPSRYRLGDEHRNQPRKWEFKGRFYDEDPLLIPRMTESILSQLQPAPERRREVSSFKRRLEDLPTELYCHIIQFVLEDFVFPRVHGLLPQQFWKGMLYGGRFFPFLWDLDPQVTEPQDGTEWDWELLVRSIARDGLDPNKPSPLTPGLRNRRRIWQLVEDLRAGTHERDYII